MTDQFIPADISALIDVAQAATGVHEIYGTPYVLVPERWDVKDLSAMLPRPLRKRGAARLTTREDFLEMLEREKTEGTVIFADRARGIISAVVDFHSPTTPGNCDYRIEYAPRLDPEWEAWRDFSKEWHSQTDLAQFLEDHIEAICSGGDDSGPSGADILKLARDLSVTRNVAFSSRVDVQSNAVSIKYEEKDVSGSLRLHESFFILVAIYEREEPVPLRVRPDSAERSKAG